MKFRLIHNDNRYNATYFYTKKEAMAWLNNRTDKEEYTLQRKAGYEWY